MKFKRFSNPFHPGEILIEEFLEPKRLSQRGFARQLGWTPRKLNEIIKGKRNITASTAIDLAQALDTTPEFWLNLQQAWDLNRAYRLRRACFGGNRERVPYLNNATKANSLLGNPETDHEIHHRHET